MPPTAKITRQMILGAALAITRQTGFQAVNARSLAARLQCSTRPLFTCYQSMEQLKSDFLGFAWRYYEQYVADYGRSETTSPALLLPLAYIAFARQEPNLFQLLFVNDMDLSMARAADFYKEPGNEKRAAAFAENLGLDPERAKGIFLDLFLYTHGIAVLTATKKLALERPDAEKMISNIVSALAGRKE